MSIIRKSLWLTFGCCAGMLGMIGAAPLAVAQAPLPAASTAPPTAGEGKLSETSARRIMELFAGGTHSDGVAADAAFSKFVDLAAVAKGIEDYDAGSLADAALALAEAERIFGRKHSSGISAQFLLRKAAIVAVDVGDKSNLARLAAAAEKLGQKNILDQAEGARGSATRATFLESAGTKSEALLTVYRTAKAAELMADARQLELAEQMASDSDVSDEEKTALKKVFAGVRQRLPKQPSQEEEALQAVTKQFGGYSIIIQGTWTNAGGSMIIAPGDARSGNWVMGNIIMQNGQIIRYEWVSTHNRRGQIYLNLGTNAPKEGPIFVSLTPPKAMRWEFGLNKVEFTGVN